MAATSELIPELKSLYDALEALCKQILDSSNQTTRLSQQHNMLYPSLTKDDFTDLPIAIQRFISDLHVDLLTVEQSDVIAAVRAAVLAITPTVASLFQTQPLVAVSYLATMASLKAKLENAFAWESLARGAAPSDLAVRLKEIKGFLDANEPHAEAIRARFGEFVKLHDQVMLLPGDLKELSAARRRVEEVDAEAKRLQEEITNSNTAALHIIEKMTAARMHAGTLADKCEEAYHVTTTKGLAEAFSQRAAELSKSLSVWVAFLLVALGVGAYVSFTHVQDLVTGQSDKLISSLIGLGAPIWLGWLATKQIGQRFRLSEDYAFKAAFAKAYEGYRKEAARVDPQLESRLLSSALARLDEAPLRLIEPKAHGSPWHEFMDSEFFQNAFKAYMEKKAAKAAAKAEPKTSA